MDDSDETIYIKFYKLSFIQERIMPVFFYIKILYMDPKSIKVCKLTVTLSIEVWDDKFVILIK